jgi:putative transposase
VSHRDLRLPPISLWEHRQAVRELRAQGRRSLDQATIFAAVLEQRKILDSICKPSSRQRQQQERRGRAQNAGRRDVNVGAKDPALAPKMEEIDYSKLQPFEVEDWSNE